MTNRTQMLLITVLSITALLQATGVLLLDGVSPEPQLGNYIDVAPGREIGTLVRVENAREPTTVTQLAAGQCTYAIIYSPTCGASVAAAQSWKQTAAAEQGTRVFPPGWKTVWISVEDSVTSAGALPSGFPFATAFRATTSRLEPELSIRAYPVYVILDRAGRVTQSGVGAFLLERTMFLSDCRLVASTDSIGHQGSR